MKSSMVYQSGPLIKIGSRDADYAIHFEKKLFVYQNSMRVVLL